MELNDLLEKHPIDITKTIVMRHRPSEPGLRKVLPWLVHERPAVFNAYQQAQSGSLEDALEKLSGCGWIASFIGIDAGEAVFSGLYRIAGYRKIDRKAFWLISENNLLREHGMTGWDGRENSLCLWFDLRLDETFHSDWIGKLIVKWPPPERSWWRRAERNSMSVRAILEESCFAPLMPDWREMLLTWQELDLLPRSWRTALKEWRGIYLIRDMRDGLAYVGSAYGEGNLLGRWLEYAKSGDGGNKLLRLRKPDQFCFSILERLSPDLDTKDVVAVENSWKKRLGTLHPRGLNSN